MKLPCGHELPAADLASLLPEAVILQAAGSISSGRRKTIGRSGGRPRSDAPRCACGKFTLQRARKRNHRCGGEKR